MIESCWKGKGLYCCFANFKKVVVMVPLWVYLEMNGMTQYTKWMYSYNFLNLWEGDFLARACVFAHKYLRTRDCNLYMAKGFSHFPPLGFLLYVVLNRWECNIWRILHIWSQPIRENEIYGLCMSGVEST